MQTTKNPLRILIVDDNADAAYMLASLLELVGHEAHQINHPKTAIALADAYLPDVFILDIGMPEMDGFSLGAALRPKHAQATYIAHSAWARHQNRNLDRERETGFVFDFFLQKPMPIQECLALLDVIPRLEPIEGSTHIRLVAGQSTEPPATPPALESGN